jgi:hypothetical protein
MPEPLTRVLQKLGLSAKLNIWNSNEQCAKFEHSYFDFPAFAKPKTVWRYFTRTRNYPINFDNIN